MKTVLHVVPEVLTLFQAAGIADFSTLLKEAMGESISKNEQGTEVRRLVLMGEQGEERFFIKRRGKEPRARLLMMLLFGLRPRSGPLREQLLVERLKAAGFATMEPVAWGEKRRFGMPLGGFLVVRQVPGTDVATLFDRASGKQRLHLMTQMGTVVGRLHAQRFFHVVRLKDLIQTDTDMVLIDRETSKPCPNYWFSQASCLASLARTARRILRDGHRMGPGSLCAFLRGYRNGVGTRWEIAPQELAQRTIQSIRKTLGK
jgi:hypothetical protein